MSEAAFVARPVHNGRERIAGRSAVVLKMYHHQSIPTHLGHECINLHLARAEVHTLLLQCF